MAINDTTQTQTSNAPAAQGLGNVLQNSRVSAETAGAATAGTAQPTGRNVRPNSWQEQGAAFRSPISGREGAEVVNEIVAAIQENLKLSSKAFHQDFESGVTVVDREQYPTLAFSVVVVWVKNKNSVGSKFLSYHSLIVEATNDSDLSRHEQRNGRQIQITQVAGDAFDAELINVVQGVLSEEFPGHVLCQTEATRIPASFSNESTDQSKGPNYRKYIEIASSAQAAGYVDLRTRAGVQDISLANTRNDTSLVVELDFKDRDVKDIVGEPIRSDINMRFYSETRPDNNARTLNNGGSRNQIADVSGYVDLTWDPVNPNQQGFGSFAPQPQNTNVNDDQKYAANFVITDVFPELAATPATVMLSILTAAASMRVSNNYMGAFLPKYHLGGRVDPHDIGGVNLECNFGRVGHGELVKRIDTRGSDFDNQKLGQLIQMAIRPGLAISVDVPETSPSSWYLSFLRAAAQGDEGASALIIKSMDTLTEGRFSSLFRGNIFVNAGHRIHGGTVTDPDGNKIDLRDVDYLYLLNSSSSTVLTDVIEWSESFAGTYVDEQERMSRRAAILQYVAPSTRFLSFYRRVTFTDAFIHAGITAMGACGLTPAIRTPFSAADMVSQRQTAGYMNAALGDPTQVPNLFSYGQRGGVVPNGGHYGAASRYNM